MYYYYCCILFHDLELIVLSTVRLAGYMLECTTHVVYDLYDCISILYCI